MEKINLEQILEQAQSQSSDGRDGQVSANDVPEDFPPRYIVRDASYALSPLPQIEWIVDQLISAGSVNVFYGEPGSKKTYSVLSLGVCVALGKPWLGFQTKLVKVLIVDEESGEKRLALRLGATLRGEFGIDETPIFFVSLAGFMLDDKSDAKDLLELIEDTAAGFVIIDALADIMEGDENSKKDTQPIFASLRRIAELTKAAIIIIHHSNKSGGYRGSSAIKGALDTMIKIQSEDGSNWINFKTEKSRDSEKMKFSAVANWTKDQFYLSAAESEKEDKPLSNSQEYVIRYLKQRGASPMQVVMDATDSCSPNAARQAVYALVRLGKVYRTNPDERGQGVQAIYDLVENGGFYEE